MYQRIYAVNNQKYLGKLLKKFVFPAAKKSGIVVFDQRYRSNKGTTDYAALTAFNIFNWPDFL